MILILLNGRLGNNLFQIAFGKILQKNMGNRVLFIPKSTNIGKFVYFQYFKNSFLANLPYIMNWFGKIVVLFIPFRKYTFESQFIDIQPNIKFGNSYVLGYFQNSTYLVNNKDYLKELFQIKKKYVNKFQREYGKFFKDKRVLTIQIRLGDYLDVYFKEINSKAFIGWDWFSKVIGSLDMSNFDHIFLISDDIELALQNLPLENSIIKISDGNEITDFQLLLYSDVLVISNSSFAWWGAFLNSKPCKKVYAPHNWVGYNAGIEYPANIMIDEFTWIK